MSDIPLSSTPNLISAVRDLLLPAKDTKALAMESGDRESFEYWSGCVDAYNSVLTLCLQLGVDNG